MMFKAVLDKLKHYLLTVRSVYAMWHTHMVQHNQVDHTRAPPHHDDPHRSQPLQFGSSRARGNPASSVYQRCSTHHIRIPHTLRPQAFADQG